MNFKLLIESIENVHSAFYNQSVKAVNVNLTLRNWAVGLYIVEFEQNGEDRAEYGKQLLINIADKIKIKGLGKTGLKMCRQFYKIYPEIINAMTPEIKAGLPPSIGQTASDQFKEDKSYLVTLLQNTSFRHFVELVQIDDKTKRRFYELLILKTTPTVKELKRQIETLTFERFGLSGNKELAMQQLANKIVPAQSSDLVKSHYFFDFMNINQPQLIENEFKNYSGQNR